MTEMTSFCIYMDWEEQLSDLTDEERGQIFSAIFEYKRTGIVPELPRILALVFSFIRQQLDRDAEKYEQKIEKRREAGKQGGRPPKAPAENESEKKQEKAKKANGFSENQSEAKKADTDTDTVTDTIIYNNTDVLFPQSDFSNLPALPLVDGTEFILSNSEVDNYKMLYPGIDVEQQIRSMVGWLGANPKNRKTRNGIKRFINSWLSREQNKAPRVQGSSYGTNSVEDVLRQVKEMERMAGYR